MMKDSWYASELTPINATFNEFEHQRKTEKSAKNAMVIPGNII